jgi:hypothetical protein
MSCKNCKISVGICLQGYVKVRGKSATLGVRYFGTWMVVRISRQTDVVSTGAEIDIGTLKWRGSVSGVSLQIGIKSENLDYLQEDLITGGGTALLVYAAEGVLDEVVRR